MLVTAVPMVLYPDDWCAVEGTPPGQPQRVPEPCVLCGSRTDWRMAPPREFQPDDEFPLCLSCQQEGAFEDLARIWRRRNRPDRRKPNGLPENCLCRLRRPV